MASKLRECLYCKGDPIYMDLRTRNYVCMYHNQQVPKRYRLKLSLLSLVGWRLLHD